MILGLMLGGGVVLLTGSALSMTKETMADAALMKQRDPDDDGTLDEAEFKSLAGQKLLTPIA